jgi:hypothetical protein
MVLGGISFKLVPTVTYHLFFRVIFSLIGLLFFFLPLVENVRYLSHCECRAGVPLEEGELRNIMPLIHLIMSLVVVIVLLWFINIQFPMDRNTRTIVNGVILISLVVWLLKSYGVIGFISNGG